MGKNSKVSRVEQEKTAARRLRRFRGYVGLAAVLLKLAHEISIYWPF